MQAPQIVVYENDGRLKLQLEALAEERRWALRETRRPETCLRLLARGGPAVLVVKAGRDLERELALLERAAWLYPDAPVVLAADGDQPELAGLAWDLGAACVLLPPQPRERLPEIVAGLMGEKREAEKA
jgi:DNA-binding NtrC family response regulator